MDLSNTIYDDSPLSAKDKAFMNQISLQKYNKNFLYFEPRAFFNKQNLKSLALMDQSEWLRHSEICFNSCSKDKKTILNNKSKPENFSKCIKVCQTKLDQLNSFMKSEQYLESLHKLHPFYVSENRSYF